MKIFRPGSRFAAIVSVRLLATLVCVCSGCGVTVLGQGSSATISGTVFDEAGGLITGAVVEVVETGTGSSRTMSTNAEGVFVLSLLRPSTYRMTVRRSGFAIAEIKELQLRANDRVELTVKLKVGEPTEYVEVPDEGLIIRSESADIGTTIGRRIVESVPLNGRSFQSLVTLAPGVTMTRSDATNQGQFSVNGQRADSNYFLVDGVSTNFSAQGPYSLGGAVPATNSVGSTASLVSIDALQELNVRTSAYSAEFGRGSGGQISVTTRSGTNKFNGSLFEYFRNDALDANDWFANSNGLEKAPLRHNDFGGVLGGPMVRDRSFFFFSYEGLRLRQPRVVNTTVPALSLRQSTPANLRPFLDAYPLPTGANVTASRARYAVTYSDPRTMDATSLRLDHRMTEGVTIFGRINLAPSRRSSTNLSTVPRTDTRTDTITFGSTQILGNRSTNELRVNLSRSRAFAETDIEPINGAVRPDDSLLFPQPFAQTGSSSFGFSIESASIGVGSSGQRQRQFNIVDNFSISRGDHQLRFGLDFRVLAPVSSTAKYTQSITTTPSLLANGRASRVLVSARLGDVFPRYTNFSVYGQDVWQVNRRFTLTYGLRWDVNPPPTEKNGNYPIATEGGFDPDEITLVPGVYPFWKTRYTNLAPRVGVAYLLGRRPSSETVVRGGFGVFYDVAMGNASAAMRPGFFPYTGTKTLTNVPIPLSDSNATPPVFNLNPPYQEVFVYDREINTPRTYEWSLGVEQAIGSGQSLSVSFVGNAGRQLISDQFLSQPNPNFFRLHIVRDTGTSDYRSLQVQYQRRSNHGLDAIVSYTLGRSLDTSSNDSSYLNTVDPEEILLDRGPSDFDVRHSLSMAVAYRVPAFKAGRFFSALVNGWSVSGMFIARSAMPITYMQALTTFCEEFICFVDCEQFPNSLCPRPDLVPGEPIYIRGREYPGGKRLNPAAFVTPPPGRQGTLGRNALRGFPAVQLDISLKRSFSLTEKVELQLAGEVFNIFNHPNFADPEGFLYGEPELDHYSFGIAYQMLGRTGGTTGRTAGEAGLNPMYQLGTPRSIQLSARLRF